MMRYSYNIILVAGAVEVKGDEFWDYDQQVDLEAFDSQKMYDILSRQARDATKELGKQKEEVSLIITQSRGFRQQYDWI